jgi:hypothetical protein
MIANAEAERVFSMQNGIKTQLRNQLTIERLDKLLRIKYHENINIAHLQAAAERFLGLAEYNYIKTAEYNYIR